MQLTIRILFLIIFLISDLALFCLKKTQAENDRLIQGQLFNGSMSLVSAGNKFVLGFFPGGSSNRLYLGIWFNNIPVRTTVWVANRDIPLNSSGILSIGNDGNLILQNLQGVGVWSTNVLNISASGTEAQLLDSGNLVLKYADDDLDSSQPYLWQSFDHPSDTFLEGMKLGWDFRIGLNKNLTSWMSHDDPSPGGYSYALDASIYPQVILAKGSTKLYRGGLYDYQVLNGKLVRKNAFFEMKLISTQQEVYAEFDVYNNNLSITTLSYTGEIARLVWDNEGLVWNRIGTHPGDLCDSYNRCGPNAICTAHVSQNQTCLCLIGHTPKSEGNNMIVSSDGCIRNNTLNCSLKEGFLQMTGIKIPDTLNFRMHFNMDLKECRKECLKNCSCRAFSNGDPSGADSGSCLLWFSDLHDLRKSEIYNQLSFYIRLTAEELDSLPHSEKKERLKIIEITVPVAFVLLIGVLFIGYRKQIHGKGKKPEIQSSCMQELVLPTIEMSTISEATDSFSNSNMIGEGGFGPVYKGELATGQKIAIKRLSINSKQGLTEFRNEVVLISKLQHRNLVRLLGCCICGEERMLIYEYMPNKSLDNYIYDRGTRKVLSWKMRFDIIIGIARGLLYLHRDSRLKIVHRDLKASNILLDTEMNPKISDFGTARAFKEEQLLDKTTRVVGTYGYMAPEYITKGLYSMKSDVFSFGVLLLEIVSGRRNRDLHPDRDLNLVAQAWKLWTEGNGCKLIDELMEDAFPISEVKRCIQVGLLCVQRRPDDRPTMSSVVLMLDAKSTALPQPKKPAFLYTTMVGDMEEGSPQSAKCSTNDVTLTELHGR